MTHFLTSPVVVNIMPISKEDKTLIKTLFTLEYYNSKKVSWKIWNVGRSYWVSQTSSQQWQTMYVPVLLIPMILFTNWSYTKIDRR